MAVAVIITAAGVGKRFGTRVPPEMVGPVIILLVLLIRPTGLFGRASAVRV